MSVHIHVDGTGRSSQSCGSVDRRRDQLLPIVAHELRQPLTSILMALEGVCGDESAARDCLDIAKLGARHMSRIIDDVLDTYLDVHGRIRLNLAQVDLNSIVQAAITTARPNLAAKGHRVSVSLPPDPVLFIADSSRLRQVLTNLLTNACKYTDSGGLISVTGGKWSDVVVIRVEDNGRGIKPDLIPRIFEPFQHGEDGGLGLGLALVKSLVELHGGSVAVDSDGDGMGSEFVVHLPARGPDVDAGTDV